MSDAEYADGVRRIFDAARTTLDEMEAECLARRGEVHAEYDRPAVDDTRAEDMGWRRVKPGPDICLKVHVNAREGR